MDEVGFSLLAFEATLWKCGRLALASLACWLILKGLDKLGNVDFKQSVLGKLYASEGSVGLGIYFGLRFLGVALLGAAIFGGAAPF